MAEVTWRILLPLVILELVLMVAALLDISRREPERIRGPKWAWVLVSVFVATLGPIVYFLFGRKE